VNGGKRITDRGTRQGTWILAPGGEGGGVVLARAGSGSVEATLAAMEKGLSSWEQLDEASRRLPGDVELEPAHRWEGSYPEAGVVLDRVARDLDEHGLEGKPHPRWNRDMVWFSKEEIGAMLPERMVPRMAVDLSGLARRLARFHLVDNVRGQTLPYADEEIVKATLKGDSIARVGDTIVFAFKGETLARAKGPWLLGENLWKPGDGRQWPRGIETRMMGRMNVDVNTREVSDFELLVVGRCWGRTAMNGRGRAGAEPRLIAFHLQLDPSGRRMAPTFVTLYDADWVGRPAVPTWRESPEECGLPVDGDHTK